MSDIDRIAEKALREIGTVDDMTTDSEKSVNRTIIRAALLEYGAIVREEFTETVRKYELGEITGKEFWCSLWELIGRKCE